MPVTEWWFRVVAAPPLRLFLGVDEELRTEMLDNHSIHKLVQVSVFFSSNNDTLSRPTILLKVSFMSYQSTTSTL